MFIKPTVKGGYIRVPPLTSQNLSANVFAPTNIAHFLFVLCLPGVSDYQRARNPARIRSVEARKDVVPPCNCSGAGIRFFKTFK